MSTNVPRRNFLKTGLVAGAAVSLAGKLAPHALGEEKEAPKPKNAEGKKSGKPDLVAVAKGSRVDMLDAALKELGGIKAFVKPGQTVVLKPNIGWDRKPELGANTHPDLVGHMVKLCKEAGAKEVNVFDNTCHDWKASYANSGIEAAVEAAGGKMVNGKDETMYVEMELPEAVKLKKAKVHKLIKDSDVYINMPVMKNHSGGVITAALKNVMGIVWDRGFFHGNDLQQCIADGVLIRKPDLNILDAFHPMKRNGPVGKDESDLIPGVETLIVSVDPVACDAAGSMLIGLKPSDVPHIALAEKGGFGVGDLSKLNIKRINLGKAEEAKEA